MKILKPTKKILRIRTNLIFGIGTLLLTGIFSCVNSNPGSKSLDGSYPLVDTNQGLCYNNNSSIEPPAKGEPFYGQDAQYTGNVPGYTDNGNGTITDNVTGLIWTQELSDKSMVWSDAENYAKSLTTGDIKNWRVPTLKELWSIRDFSQGWPWVDTDYFHLVGSGKEGAQQHSWSINYYKVNTRGAKENIAFVVNDWTGHIKAMDGMRFVRCVSGEPYGINSFVSNGDQTVTDKATGLMWAQDDSGEAMNWEKALSFAENSTYAGYEDWRLPNVKELQSIVDYSGKFPTLDTSVFKISKITNEAGNEDYPYFWTSTTNPHIDARDAAEQEKNGIKSGYWYAWYVAFGYAVGQDGQDLHGAGAVRFDTKVEGGGDGPDGERYYNYVRLVRGGNVKETPKGDSTTVKSNRVVIFKDGETGSPEMRGSRPDGTNGVHPDGPQPGGQRGRPDFKSASQKLGKTEKEIMDALSDPRQGPPDFEAAAKKLGITQSELMEALGTSGEIPQRKK